MARKPEPRFDYEYLSGLVSSEAPREVFFLDEAAQSVLSALAEIVRWDTRWDNADTNDIDFIEFRSAIYEALKVPYHFDDLIPLVDNVETLLASIRDAQCCTPGGNPQTNPGDTFTIQPTGLTQDQPPLDTTDSNTWPPDLETDDTGATDFADLSALSDYLCRAATTVFDLLLDMIAIASWFHNLAYGINQLTATWIATAIQRAFPTAQGTLVAFAYEQLYELASPWAEQLDSALLDGARSELEAARAGIVCAFANAETWEEAVTDVSAILATTLTSSVIYTWLTSGGVIGLVAALLFRGWADPVDNTCDCTAPAVLTSIFTKQGDACTPAGSTWVLNPNPVQYWYTNTPMTFDDSITYGNCSSGDRLAIGFYDEDLLDNPKVVVTACRVKLVDWVASGYANAIIFMDTSWNQIGTVANGSVVLGQWIDAPANTHAILVDYQNGYTAIQIQIELLEY